MGTERKITVSVELTPHRDEVFSKSTDKISLKENSTIHDLLALLYKAYLTNEKCYDENAGWVNIFCGHQLFKSGEFIGSFGKEGLVARQEANIEIKDGDKMFIALPFGGG